MKANRFEIFVGSLAVPHVFAWFLFRDEFTSFAKAFVFTWLSFSAFLAWYWQDLSGFYWMFIGTSCLAIVYIMLTFLFCLFRNKESPEEIETVDCSEQKESGIESPWVIFFMPLPFAMIWWRYKQKLIFKVMALLIMSLHLALFGYFREQYTHWLLISSIPLLAILLVSKLTKKTSQPKQTIKQQHSGSLKSTDLQLARKNKLASVLPNANYSQQAMEKLVSYQEHELVNQLQKVNDFYQTFSSLLNQKFSPEEQTYKRYATSVDALYNNIIGSVKRYLNLRLSIDSIAIDELRERLLSSELGNEIRAALQARVELYEEAKVQMAVIRGNNEVALTKLISLSMCLGALQTESRPSSSLNDLLSDINELLNEPHSN